MKRKMEQYQKLLEYAQRSAQEYIRGIDQAAVYPDAESLAALARFDESLPETGTDALSVLELLNTIGAKGTTAQIGGRYFGFVNGGLLPVAHAAEWIADTWNQNGALAVMSPVTATLEKVCERWLAELLGLEQGTAMGLVTGSSNATLCALAAARNSLLNRLGYDVKKNGMRNAPPLHILISEDAHASVGAALSVLGFGREEVKAVPTDEYGRIRADAIPEMDNRTLCILQAGNVNGGSYDPIDEICDKARKAGAWVHIDGAIPLWAVLKTLGASGVEQLIDTLCERAEYFADRLKAAGFDVINPVFFNQFMACETDAKTEAVLHAIQNSGVCWCSGSKWKGRSVIRVSVCSYATTQEDIDQSVTAFKNTLEMEVNA